MIDIQFVTNEQAEILDQIWACETEDDILELREAMDPGQWQTLDLLIEAIALAMLDDKVHSEVDCTEARNILDNIG